jgi:hypothetical protein
LHRPIWRTQCQFISASCCNTPVQSLPTEWAFPATGVLYGTTLSLIQQRLTAVQHSRVAPAPRVSPRQSQQVLPVPPSADVPFMRARILVKAAARRPFKMSKRCLLTPLKSLAGFGEPAAWLTRTIQARASAHGHSSSPATPRKS